MDDNQQKEGRTWLKTALVMEGGAMRGMFTCGVIIIERVLQGPVYDVGASKDL